MFERINLSFYADPVLAELTDGEPKIDGTVFWEVIRQAQGPILELGCGYGRLTIPLAQRGITDLTGLELSAPSLAYARTKAGGLPTRWVEADVRDFHLDRRYALIFARGCVFNFMLTRVDQEAMLARVREHLADDGQFLFDSCGTAPSRMVNVLEEAEWYKLSHPSGRQIYVSGTDRFDLSQQLWVQTGFERWDGPEGDLVRPPWEQTLRYVMPQEMETLLDYNGFVIVAKYADYDGTPETPDEPAGVYICKKR